MKNISSNLLNFLAVFPCFTFIMPYDDKHSKNSNKH